VTPIGHAATAAGQREYGCFVEERNLDVDGRDQEEDREDEPDARARIIGPHRVGQKRGRSQGSSTTPKLDAGPARDRTSVRRTSAAVTIRTRTVSAGGRTRI
jgi:hypothetical protein